MRRILVTLLVMVLTAAACGGLQGEKTREVVGLVVDIRTGSGFGEVESFTVKDGSEVFEIFVDPGATYDFPLAHLNSHRAGAEPVRVEVMTQDGRLVATAIGDV